MCGGLVGWLKMSLDFVCLFVCFEKKIKFTSSDDYDECGGGGDVFCLEQKIFRQISLLDFAHFHSFGFTFAFCFWWRLGNIQWKKFFGNFFLTFFLQQKRNNK